MPNDPVAEFEHQFAEKIGSRYAIAVNSGTSALHATLVACDVGGGEVIMPALCPAMDAFAIIHAGAIPVFADVDPLTHLVTHDTIRKVTTERTKGIIAVALHGLPTDARPIMEFAKDRGISVIEDCAQALLARYQDGFAGSKTDFGCFSFERKKHLATGSEGGVIVTNNEELAIKARKFAGIGYKHMTAEAGRTSLNASVFQRPDYARFDTIGLNYRMSHVQAEIGIEKLKTIDNAIKLRQEIGQLWQEAIGEECQPHDYDADNTFYSAAFPYDGDWIRLYNEFCAAGGDGFYAMPLCPYNEPALINYRQWWNLKEGQKYGKWHPIAEGLQKSLVILKTHYRTLAHAKRQADIMASIL